MTLQENKDKEQPTLLFYVQNNQTTNSCRFIVDIYMDEKRVKETGINMTLKPDELKQGSITFKMPEGKSDIILSSECE